MDKKIILMSIDGMRPDGALKCGHPFVQELMSRSSYSLNARTVMPSVTLPCHMSLFHSVDHGRSELEIDVVHMNNVGLEGIQHPGKFSVGFCRINDLKRIQKTG